jgi:hypothetical protein
MTVIPFPQGPVAPVPPYPGPGYFTVPGAFGFYNNKRLLEPTQPQPPANSNIVSQATPSQAPGVTLNSLPPHILALLQNYFGPTA